MPQSNIFMSMEFLRPKPAQNKGRKALVLIQGTGAVRAGIWARSACINENLEVGSMLPFVDKCRDLGIPVLVMNPNYNEDPESGVSVPYDQTMQDHALWVWDKYVKDSGFENICVVAHSAGGDCLQQIQKNFPNFYQQVEKIAYTDSWVIDKEELTEEQQLFMYRNAVHYEASDEPVGTRTQEGGFEENTCPVVSAGHPRHEYTTGYAQ